MTPVIPQRRLLMQILWVLFYTRMEHIVVFIYEHWQEVVQQKQYSNILQIQVCIIIFSKFNCLIFFIQEMPLTCHANVYASFLYQLSYFSARDLAEANSISSLLKLAELCEEEEKELIFRIFWIVGTTKCW